MSTACRGSPSLFAKFISVKLMCSQWRDGIKQRQRHAPWLASFPSFHRIPVQFKVSECTSVPSLDIPSVMSAFSSPNWFRQRQYEEMIVRERCWAQDFPIMFHQPLVGCLLDSEVIVTLPCSHQLAASSSQTVPWRVCTFMLWPPVIRP